MSNAVYWIIVGMFLQQWVLGPLVTYIKYPFSWRCSACGSSLRSNKRLGLEIEKRKHLKDHGF